MDNWWHALKKLANQLQLAEFDNDQYSARFEEQTLLLTPEQALIIQCAQQAENQQDFLDLISQYIADIDQGTLATISQILIEKIQQLIDSPEQVYTSLNVPLYKLAWINHLAWKLRGIMTPTVFYKWLSVSIITLIACFTLTIDSWQNVDLNVATLGAFYLVLIFSGLLHETGHMIAGQAIERKNIQISFGFYLFIPVLYSDLSHIWSASREKRIIANLAGVAIESLFALLLIAIHMLSGQPIWLHLALLICWSAVSNLLPFGRSDGYWILCDLFKQPNLLPRFLPSLLDWKAGKKQTASQRFPALYGLFNLTFMIGLFAIIISEMHDLMLAYPQRLWQFVTDLIQQQPVIPLTIQDLWLFGLWFFCFRLLYMFTRFFKAIRGGQASDSNQLGI